MRKILAPSPTRERKILDPEVKSAATRRKEAKAKAPNGKPKPVTSKGTRKFVGITPGLLVRVAGERDTKFLVVSEPYRELRGERVPAVTRGTKHSPTMVDLIGPNGPRTVRLGWCIPVLG